MSFSAIHGLNVWDFNPWDSEPWASKVEFVREIQQTLQESRQPMHAEMMLLLARCYAEGYGVTPDIGAALKHAHNALVLGSTEATCMIYALNAMYTGTPSNTTFASVTPELQESVAKSLATVTKIWNSAFKSVTHHDVEEHRLLSGELVEIKAIGLRHVLRSWNRHAAAAILDAEFRVQIGDVPPRFKWTARSIAEMEVLMKEYGKPLCDIIITHPTQLGPNMTSTFLETCASIGWFSGLSAEHISVEDTTDFSDTCYGDQVDFLLRLLIAATKSGQTAVLAHLIHVIKTLKSEQSYLQGVVFGTGTGESPLHHIYNLEVTEEEVTDLVLQLLDLGIEIDGPVTTRSWIPPYGIEMYGTPLQVAVRAKCLKSVKALVNAGADITASHNELPPALSIAISMHCPLITRYLLPLMDGQAAAENAVRALGTPPKKGWFEDVLTETLTFENVVTVTENLTLEDVVNETLTFTFTFGEGSSMVHTAAEIFYHLHGCPFKDLPDWWYQELDGLPLMEAIERGQRNIKVMATLIQLGLGPRSFEGRWKILQAILNKSKDDPFRPQLLALLFSRRMIDSMGWLSKFLWEDNLLHAYQHTTELVEGWPEFFRQFRGECHDWSLLHILAQDSDYQAVNHVLSFFPHGDTTHQCLSHVDDFGLTPVHVAHSRTDKDVYRLMMRQFPPKYKGPIKMLRSISEAQLSYEYQENMFIKFMDKYGYTWKHIRRTQGVELRFRGPVWEETQLIAKAEAEKNLAPGSLGTGLIGLDGTGYEGLEKFWHNGRITHETKIMRAIAKETVPKAKIAELFFDYACWTLQNEYFSLAKAEDLCVMGNLYKMEATGLGSGRTLLELPLRKWTVPEPFCRIYTMQSIMGKSPEEMVRRAYQRLLRVPPDYIPNLRQQEEQMGPEALREYYSRERRVDYVTEGGGGSRLLSIRPDVWQRMRL